MDARPTEGKAQTRSPTLTLAPLETALTHNYPPTDEEVDCALSLRAEKARELSELNNSSSDLQSQMARLQAQLSELESKKECKQRTLASFDCVLSPLRRFPPELIQEIASESLSQYIRDSESLADGGWDTGGELPGMLNIGYIRNRKLSMRRRSSPNISLSRVCRSWRRAILGLPHMWDKLTLHVSPHTASTSGMGDFMTEYFARAGQRPLHIKLFIHNSGRITEPEGAELSALDDVRQFVDWFLVRWELISRVGFLDIESATNFQALIPDTRHVGLTSLRSLVINESPLKNAHLAFDFGETNGKWLQTLASASKVLEDVDIGNLRRFRIEDGPTSLSQISWATLTRLRLYFGIMPRDWIALLDVCENLVEGWFVIEEEDDFDLLMRPPHRTLQVLDVILWGDRVGPMFKILTHRKFENVHTLAIQFDAMQDVVMQGPFGLSACFPLMKKLGMRIKGLAVAVPYADFFTDNPEITHLSFEGNMNTAEEFYSALTLSAEPPATLPNGVLPGLSTLEIAHMRTMDDGNRNITKVGSRILDHVSNMAKSRFRPPQRNGGCNDSVRRLQHCRIAIAGLDVQDRRVIETAREDIEHFLKTGGLTGQSVKVELVRDDRDDVWIFARA